MSSLFPRRAIGCVRHRINHEISFSLRRFSVRPGISFRIAFSSTFAGSAGEPSLFRRRGNNHHHLLLRWSHPLHTIDPDGPTNSVIHAQVIASSNIQVRFKESVIFCARSAVAVRTEVRPMSESPNVVASGVLTPCFGVFYRGTPD